MVFGFETASSPGWTDGSTGVNWDRRSGRTPTSRTGPEGAHSGDWYYYTETSSRPSGQLYDLVYTCPHGSNAEISWWYHMHGSSIGTLRLKDGVDAVVWSKSGAQGESWQNASAIVSTRSFTFQAERGGSYRGDIAIDDVAIHCSGNPMPSLPPDSPR